MVRLRGLSLVLFVCFLGSTRLALAISNQEIASSDIILYPTITVTPSPIVTDVPEIESPVVSKDDIDKFNALKKLFLSTVWGKAGPVRSIDQEANRNINTLLSYLSPNQQTVPDSSVLNMLQGLLDKVNKAQDKAKQAYLKTFLDWAREHNVPRTAKLVHLASVSFAAANQSNINPSLLDMILFQESTWLDKNSKNYGQITGGLYNSNQTSDERVQIAADYVRMLENIYGEKHLNKVLSAYNTGNIHATGSGYVTHVLTMYHLFSNKVKNVYQHS